MRYFYDPGSAINVEHEKSIGRRLLTRSSSCTIPEHTFFNSEDKIIKSSLSLPSIRDTTSVSHSDSETFGKFMSDSMISMRVRSLKLIIKLSVVVRQQNKGKSITIGLNAHYGNATEIRYV